MLGDGDVGQRFGFRLPTLIFRHAEYVSSAASSAAANVNDAPTGEIQSGDFIQNGYLYAHISTL